MADGERRAVTSGHGEDLFHMRLWSATQHLLSHADDDHPGTAFDRLAATVLAFNTLEAYLNFLGERLAPDAWNNERDFFSRQPYRGFAGKIKFIFEKSGIEEPPKDIRPYSSVWAAKDFRDLVAHGKSEREVWEVEHSVDDEKPRRVPRFELLLRKDRARQFADDIEQIIERVHAAIRERFADDMAFRERALSGFLGYSSQTTRVVE